eukprot:5840058-Amphidinium_carterae.1
MHAARRIRMGSTSSVAAFDVPGDIQNNSHSTRSTSFAVQGMWSTSSPSIGLGGYNEIDGSTVCAR